MHEWPERLFECDSESDFIKFNDCHERQLYCDGNKCSGLYCDCIDFGNSKLQPDHSTYGNTGCHLQRRQHHTGS